jgi:DNA-binding transcriptional LysR family regulator
LTNEGRVLFESAQEMIAAAESGLSRASANAGSPSGRLSVASPAALISGPLMDDLAAFAHAYPRVGLTLYFSDAPVDLIGNGIDVAIRAGSLKDSSWKSKKLFEMRRKLVAAPAYLAKKPAPATPRDLAGWDWIKLHSRPAEMSFTGPGGEVASVAFSPRMVADSAEAMFQLALRGLGLAVVPALIAQAQLQLGGVVEVLPAWRLEAPTAYAVWPANAPRSSLSARLIAFLGEGKTVRGNAR